MGKSFFQKSDIPSFEGNSGNLSVIEFKDLPFDIKRIFYITGVPKGFERGFGGSCFPKDIQAMIKFSESIGIEPNVLRGSWKTNLEVRPEKDWENLKGRAIEDD